MIRRGSTAGVAFVLLLFVLLCVSSYYLYLTLDAEPLNFVAQPSVDQSGTVYHTSTQFYENMRFPDRRISYSIEGVCGDRASEATAALDLLSSQTVLSFYPNDDNPELLFVCSEIPNEPAIDEGYFVAGEGGPTEVINTSLYAVIFEGKISLFREEKCSEPKIALHEILHALGFDHNNNPQSILYPTLNCNQEIDQAIIDDINRLYEQDTAPDLKIIAVSAQKTGRYLNFEIEVANQGLTDASDAVLHVYHDGELVEFESGKDSLVLGDVDVGTKKILTVTNARVDRSSTMITFLVDSSDSVEIFEANNRMELTLVPSN